MTARRYLDGIYLTWDLIGGVSIYRKQLGYYELIDTAETNYIDDAPHSYEPYTYKIVQGETEETATVWRPYFDNFLIHNTVQYLTAEDGDYLKTEDGKFIII
jgi:hypothetical protein